MLDEAANIRSYAANERGEHAGRLLLATTHTQARYVLPPVIAAIKREFPQVNVDLQAAGDAEVLHKLAHEGADLALISTAGSVPTGGLAVPLLPLASRVAAAARAPVGRTRSRADAGRIGEASADQLRIVDERRFLAAPRVRRRGRRTAGGDDGARCQPDQDLRARRPRRGLLAEMAIGTREDADLCILAAPSRVARMHHLGGDSAWPRVARLRAGAAARPRAAARSS